MTKTAATKTKGDADKKPRVTIGSLARQLILDGKTNEQVIAEVVKKFPDSNITTASVNWYRSDLRKAGKKVPKLVKDDKKPAKPAAKGKPAVKSGKKKDDSAGF